MFNNFSYSMNLLPISGRREGFFTRHVVTTLSTAWTPTYTANGKIQGEILWVFQVKFEKNLKRTSAPEIGSHQWIGLELRWSWHPRLYLILVSKTIVLAGIMCRNFKWLWFAPKLSWKTIREIPMPLTHISGDHKGSQAIPGQNEF